MKLENYIKSALMGIGAIFVYYFLSNMQLLVFYLLDIDISVLPSMIRILYAVIYEILIMCVLIMIYNKKLINDFKDLKENHKKYYGECFKYWLIGLGIMLMSNFIIILILNKGLSTNEDQIRTMFSISPMYIYFSGVIFAPIVEELVFRMSVKKIIPNKYLFVILSGLLFGYVHLEGNINNMGDLLYLIPYSALGVAFAYMYEKTKNIYTSIGFHLMHNGILLGLQFLILFL